jgi:DNA mismatch endonuclease, patch repair protein
MADRLTEAARSALMAAIRCRDTGPELAVRRALRCLGVGYRLHVRGLPGRPDIVMKGRRTVIFVHGCFWHRHGCRAASTPKSRQDYWQPKFDGNVARDARNEQQLRAIGWTVLVIWECETKDAAGLAQRLGGMLGQQLSN